MARQVVLAVLACLVATAVAGRPSVEGAAMQAVGGSTTCQACLALKGYLDSALPNPQEQQHWMEALTQMFCAGLEPVAKDHCSKSVPLVVPTLITWAADRIDELCFRQGVCSENTARAGVSALTVNGLAARAGFECPMCEMIMTTVLTDLQDPATQAALVAQMHTACGQVPDQQLAAECTALVDQYSTQLFGLLQDLSPTGLCQMLQACEAASSLVLSADAKLAFAKLSTLLKGPQGVANDNDCGTCKMVVVEVATIIRNPNTQKEIMDYAKQACASFQQYQAQCVQYVDMYGPLVFGMLETYLQPDTLCTRLGFCPVPPPGVAALTGHGGHAAAA